MLYTIDTMASRPIVTPMYGPTPRATPTAGSTNGNTMYINRHRQVLMNSDFWNADRASPAVDVRPSGRRSRRRMNRSAGEIGDVVASSAGTVVGSVVDSSA